MLRKATDNHGTHDPRLTPETVWVMVPRGDDTAEECAQWFVDRVVAAIGLDKGLKVRPYEFDLLEQDTSLYTPTVVDQTTRLYAKLARAVRLALAQDIKIAQREGLLDEKTGLPLSWLAFHDKALEAARYPVAARIAAVVADLP